MGTTSTIATILVGPAGSGGRGPVQGLEAAARRRLDCLEIAFTYGVRMTPEVAEAVGERAAQLGILLSVHAPYYINLASYEEAKLAASRQRILDSCHRAHLMGARKVVFHAGFYQKRSPQETYDLVRREIEDLQQAIRKAGWQVALYPEITGKPSQFGDLEELLALREATGCGLTVDFAHLFARHQGVIDYDALMPVLPKAIHAHFTGIAYGPMGEKKHIRLQPTHFVPLLAALVAHAKQATVICESPKPFEDAVMMKTMVTGRKA